MKVERAAALQHLCDDAGHTQSIPYCCSPEIDSANQGEACSVPVCLTLTGRRCLVGTAKMSVEGGEQPPAVRICATSCDDASRASAAARSAATVAHRSCHNGGCTVVR